MSALGPGATIKVLDRLQAYGLTDQLFGRIHHLGPGITIKAHLSYCSRTPMFLRGGTNEATCQRLQTILECMTP